MSVNFLEYKLPTRLYRRLLMLTDAWDGVRAAPGSLLVRCHTGGEGSPLFWCGTPYDLQSFYDVMGHERSVYCLCGTYGVLPPSEENIRALAKYYAAEIINIQPQGPYILGGYCEAGLISYEIAKLMYENDYQVGMLFLFDRDVTESDFWLRSARRLFMLVENLLFRWKQLLTNPVQCVKEVLVKKCAQLVAFPMLFVKGKFDRAQAEQPIENSEYKLTPYPGKVHLIYVKCGLLGYFQFSFFQHYWRKLALGGVDYQIIPGSTHFKPDWSKVAQSLRTFIKDVGIQ
jgi:thioesterase domain-containing protein